MLLVTDLDGTLLTSQKTITPRTRQALVDFRQRGGLLAACSARPVSSMARLLQQQQVETLFDWCAGFNGGQILELASHRILHSAALTRMDLREIDRHISLSRYPHHFLLPRRFITATIALSPRGHPMRPVYLRYRLLAPHQGISLIVAIYLKLRWSQNTPGSTISVGK